MNSTTSETKSSFDISQIHGWFDYQDLYREAVRRCPRNGTLIELGVWCGKSLAFLAREAINKGRDDIQIIGVDLWDFSMEASGWDGYSHIQGLLPMKVRDICTVSLTQAGLIDRVKLLCSDTIEASTQFPDASVDFVWFDSNHEANHVSREIKAWLPKFKRPTWCGGHDVDSPGLFAAVKEHFPDAEKVPGDFGSWRVELP